MTATAPAALSLTAPHRSRLSLAVADGITLTWRNLLGYIRIPEALFFASVQPIMFVLLFRFAFGGSINTSGAYVDYLMPGIFAQTVTFGAIGAAIGLADDKSKGLFERFRSLPMAHSAVLFGRTAADLCRNVLVVTLMVVVGFIVDFRVHTNVLAFFAGIGVVLLFAYAMAWIGAYVGLTAETGETAQLKMFPLLMVMTFASSAFVPVGDMPGWLQVFANNQPLTQIVNATRALMLGGPTTAPVLRALAWGIGILVVVAPLAVRRYRQTV